MIELFTANTPNGIKIPIALEELGITYDLRKLALGGPELRSPEFLTVNPNGKIPAIRHRPDPEKPAIDVFESGAILLYLADTFKGLIGTSTATRARTLSWLFLQVAGLGPAAGNTAHFRSLQNPEPYALGRFENETQRILQLLENRLVNFEWLNSETYSIADIAHFSWARSIKYAGLSLDPYPAIRTWVDRIEKRPATRKALERLA